jgi:cytochrome c biogenesis protein CcmG, thiol:disulfide interchange protein DsbE
MKKILLGLFWLALIGFMSKVAVDRLLTLSGEDLIGKQAYDIATNPVEGFTPLPDDLKKAEAKYDRFLLNFFATWCAPCRQEHPNLMKLSTDYKVHLVGVVTRDSPKRIAEYLHEYGNPYDYLGVDKMDITSVNYQLKGIPATYLFDKQGKVLAFHAGILSDEVLANKFIPHLQPKK